MNAFKIKLPVGFRIEKDDQVSFCNESIGVVCIYIGRSRVDGGSMFRIIGSDLKILPQVFLGGSFIKVINVTRGGDFTWSAEGESVFPYPSLISPLEDVIWNEEEDEELNKINILDKIINNSI